MSDGNVKPGRNDPCPCGSGKKYKKCCLGKSSSYGPCDGHGANGSRCGEPATGVLACKFCGKRYAGCKAHHADAHTMMSGHVLRTHPEEVPDSLDEILRKPEMLAQIGAQYVEDPAPWENLMACLEAREKGEPLPKSKIVQASDPVDAVAYAMKKEAVKQTGKDPSFRIVHGWKFGLSYGPVPEITREMFERFGASIVKRFGWKEDALPATWEEFLVRYEAEKALAGKAGAELRKKEWIFSASLHPRGRSSTEADWIFAGRMAAAIGAPVDSLKTPLETTDPNAVHYWTWFQEAEISEPS